MDLMKISYKPKSENGKVHPKEIYLQNLTSELILWIKSIKDDSIISNRWIKLAVDRFLSDLERPDLDYRQEEVNRVLKFFWYLRINLNNSYQRFHPLPFQIFMVANLFGLYYKNSDKRKYRYSFFFTARKSGKTTFSAALQLYGLVGDNVTDPQSLLLANSREQASIALSYASGIILNSPVLEKRLETQRYKILFKDRKKTGYSKIMPSNAKRLDGYSPSMTLIDEVHVMENHDLLNVIKSGILARSNPLIIIATTAGFSNTSLAADLYQTSRKILEGEVEDDSMFAMLFTLDDQDDWKNPDNWVKANPALGTVIELEDLQKEFQQALIMPQQRTNFLTKNLNIFTNDGTGWMPHDIVAKALIKNLEWEKYKGYAAYVGMDLSSTRDLTSISFTIEDEKKEIVLTKNVFFLANNPQKRMRAGGLDLTPWINNGHIIQCSTPTIDYDLVFNVFKSLSTFFNIKVVYYDRYNKDAIVPKLKKELKLKTEGFAQTTARFNAPIKELERLIFNNKWVTDNPALIWNFNNVILYMDGNGNLKFMKNKSLDSIDGAVSTVMSISAWTEHRNKVKLNSAIFSN